MEIFHSPTTSPETFWLEIALRLVLAFIGGVLVATIYRTTRPASHVNPSFPPTLVLLAILIAMVTQVIGNNTARAFSLVGALSIVRFRTVVRDTQDTAFVIFAVVVGMSLGAGSSFYPIAALGLVVGGIAAALTRAKPELGWTDTESTLNIRLGLGCDVKALLAPTFEKIVASYDVFVVTTAKQGAAIDYTYRLRLKPGFHPSEFVKELNQLEGVQSVDLRRGEPADV